MKLSELVLRSMKQNVKHYFLYFFALIFSVILYFSFQTLRYNDEVTAQLQRGSSAASGFEVATYLLYFIILVFVLYANQIFMRRRSKEIGLYQLIGMTKGLVFRLIAFEHLVLFSGAVLIGVVAGFLTSRFFAIILLKLIDEAIVIGLSFRWESVLKTFIVFGIMLLIILVQLWFIIRKQSLLDMFHAADKGDETIRRFSLFHFLMGLLGIAAITYGYQSSTTLFEGKGNMLVIRMLLVLGTTILGTYLTFRYSVALILNSWRRFKNGHLSRTDIVGLMPIMHRMKSSASSLTLITVITAVSLGINTLSYITYYTLENSTINTMPAHYISLQEEPFAQFLTKLDEEGIEYDHTPYTYSVVEADFRQMLESEEDREGIAYDVISSSRILPASAVGEKLTGDDAIVTNFGGYSAQILDFQLGELQLVGTNGALMIKEYREQSILTSTTGMSIYPVIIVSDEKYALIAEGTYTYDVQTEHHVNLLNTADEARANLLYKETGADVRELLPTGEYRYFTPQLQLMTEMLHAMGLTIFITAFLGLAFLFASGSILYFKQMSEADMESSAFTILRKIGYSEQLIMRGIYYKQLFNFGIPVCIALCHSYFAVKAGWWFFGTEYATPMLTMIVLYVCLYMMFALLTVRYYRTVVRKSF